MKFMIPEGKHHGIAGALSKDMASWMNCEESKPVPFFEDQDVSRYTFSIDVPLC